MCRNGLKLTVQLADRRIVVRHADQVRKRHGVDVSPVPVSNDRVSVRKALPVAEPVATTQPVGAATGEAPATEAAQLPERPPDANLPAANQPDCSFGSPSGLGGRDHAVSQGPSPAAVPPRYGLRDRSTIRRPDRLNYK